MSEENGTEQTVVDPTTMLMLPQGHLQRVANYLQQRPWAEANELLGLLLEARPLETEPVAVKPQAPKRR